MEKLLKLLDDNFFESYGLKIPESAVEGIIISLSRYADAGRVEIDITQIEFLQTPTQVNEFEIKDELLKAPGGPKR
jgi:hypothetical protein